MCTAWYLVALLPLAAGASGGTDIVGRLDTVGGTTYDWQTNGPAAVRVAYDPGFGIHVAWMFSADVGPGFPDRSVRYNYYNQTASPPDWAFRTGPAYMNWGTTAVGAWSGFGSLDVHPTTHCAYIGAQRGSPSVATVVRSTAPGSGTFQESTGPDSSLWPALGLTSTGRVHVAMTLDEGINNRTRLYSSRVDPWGTWSVPVTAYGTAPFPGFPNYALATGRLTPRAALAWIVSGPLREAAYLRVTTDDGVTWSAATQLSYPSTFSPGSETLPSFNPGSLFPFYDARDSLHVVASVTPVVVRAPDSIRWVLPAEIWHWSVPTGWSRVCRSVCDTSRMAGRVGFNAAFAGRPSLCQGAANELVCIWEEFDSLNVEPATGLLRADIVGARSTDNGVTWGEKTRITDPDGSSKRFPCIAGRMKGDTCIIAYVIDRLAGASALGQGSATDNPVVVQRVPKTRFRVPLIGPDVAADRILAPVGVIGPVGTVVTPACSVYNNGSTVASYEVTMRIGSFYDSTVAVSAHGPGTRRYVSFPNWTASVAGVYNVTLFTDLSGDLDPANDTARGSCTVLSGGTPGWTVAPDFPTGPRGKNVKDGACMAYRPSDEHIYALKGGNTCEFYSHDVTTDSWATEESIPPIGRSGDKKRVKKGSSLAAADGMLYATKGNKTLEFWRYEPQSDSPWVQLEDVPAGVQPLKEGTSSAPVRIGETTFVYLLKGSKTFEFYRYHPGTGRWSPRADAPTGASGKEFKNGSCIVCDPDSGVVFALKGSYNEFFAYRPGPDSWQSLTAMPLVGSSGKKKKAKKGASLAYHAGKVYALKGGNTLEFWSYDVGQNLWAIEADVPASRKKVNGGGALVYAAGANALFATKGNGTPEFYRYALGARAAPSRAGTGGVALAAGSGRHPPARLLVAPNPMHDRSEVQYTLARPGRVTLRLYDATGARVASLADGFRLPGRHVVVLQDPEVRPGVYLLQYEAEGSRVNQKLVVR